MRKKFMWSLGIIILLSMLAGCGSGGENMAESKIAKPVSAVKLKEESRPIILYYTGTIESKEVKKYSFKTAGKIAEVFVEEGKEIKKGDKLAVLEQRDLKFSLDAARAQMEAAKSQYDKAIHGARKQEIEAAESDVDKARAGYDFANKYYERIKSLYEEGAVPRQTLDEAELKLKQAKGSLEQALDALELIKNGARDEEIQVLLKQYETAKAAYDASAKMLEDSLIVADCDGYVMSVLAREGEIVAAGSPVVVVGCRDLKGRIGLAEEDVSKVKTGSEVDVTIGNESVKGTITAINKAPDEESRMYTAHISLDDDAYMNIGAIIKVAVPAGEEKGIWIPAKYILNDGEDYVFVVENGRARRRNVKLVRMLEESVCVEGLKEGEWLITQGIKSVKDGYEVAVGDSTANTMGQ